MLGLGGWVLSEITYKEYPVCPRCSVNAAFPPSLILLSFGAFLYSFRKHWPQELDVVLEMMGSQL